MISAGTVKFIALFRRLIMNIGMVCDLEDENGAMINITECTLRLSSRKRQRNIKKFLNYISYNAVRFTEPRIIMIKKQLEAILGLYSLFKGEKPIEVSGFRLKLNYWHTSPRTTLLENLGSLTSLCNCNCKICYLKGNPFWEPFMLDVKTAKLRIDHYSIESGKGLFLTTYEYGEPFLNSNFIEILKMARKKCPDEVFYPIITNGTYLSSETVRQLSELRPLILDVSLNTVNPFHRLYFMRDKKPNKAIHGVKLLKLYQIPFRGTIIAWPEISLKEVETTIRYLDENDAQLIAIYPPGYTRFHFSEYDTKQMENHWKRLSDFFLRIRENIETPILFSPNSYWNKELRAVVDGVVKNSPAKLASVRLGDIICAVNGVQVYSREIARNELRWPTNNIGPNVREISVIRNNKIATYQLKESQKEDDRYPYKPANFPVDDTIPFGIIMVETIRLSYIKEIRDILEQYNPNRALLFVSRLIKPQLNNIMKYLAVNAKFNRVKIKLKMMRNIYWGGNIMLGDLMMVEDFVTIIKEDRAVRMFSPDLIRFNHYSVFFSFKMGTRLCGQVLQRN